MTKFNFCVFAEVEVTPYNEETFELSEKSFREKEFFGRFETEDEAKSFIDNGGAEEAFNCVHDFNDLDLSSYRLIKFFIEKES